MNKNLSILLAALCIIFLISTLGSVVYYTSVIDDLNSQIANKPKLVVDGLNVEDNRGSMGNTLRIYGRINNTGEGTAYNALLHVIAFNAEGLAIDEYYNFVGITGGMSLSVDFGLAYAGSPIDNYAITPIYTDGLITPMNGTLPFRG